MGLITTSGAAAYRDWDTDGVPASGDHDVVKSDVRAVLATIDLALTSQVEGLVIGSAVIYSTLSALAADLAHNAGVLGVVYNDATVANNGVYVKSGSSGSGSWAITSLSLPSSFAVLAPLSFGAAAVLRGNSTLYYGVGRVSRIAGTVGYVCEKNGVARMPRVLVDRAPGNNIVITLTKNGTPSSCTVTVTSSTTTGTDSHSVSCSVGDLLEIKAASAAGANLIYGLSATVTYGSS